MNRLQSKHDFLHEYFLTETPLRVLTEERFSVSFFYADFIKYFKQVFNLFLFLCFAL